MVIASGDDFNLRLVHSSVNRIELGIELGGGLSSRFSSWRSARRVAPMKAQERARAGDVSTASAASASERSVGVLGMHTEQRGETCSGQVLLGS
jgi:hypothetical protein